MNKTELFDLYYRKDYLDSFVFDRWYDWVNKTLGKRPSNEYNIDDYTIYTSGVTIHCGGKEYKIPLDEFFDDQKEQPDLKMLWHHGYYDGPLSGVAEYNGVKVWFELDEEDDYQQRTYAVYMLSPDETIQLVQLHKDFQDMVGYNCDYGDLYAPYTKNPRFNEFYTKYKDRDVDYTKNTKIGVFADCQFVRSRKTVD